MTRSNDQREEQARRNRRAPTVTHRNSHLGPTAPSHTRCAPKKSKQRARSIYKLSTPPAPGRRQRRLAQAAWHSSSESGHHSTMTEQQQRDLQTKKRSDPHRTSHRRPAGHYHALPTERPVEGYAPAAAFILHTTDTSNHTHARTHQPLSMASADRGLQQHPLLSVCTRGTVVAQ